MNVSFEYCHIEAVEYIVSSFGTPLKIGSGFLSQDGIRVLVEFDVVVPLKRIVQLDNGEGKSIEIKVDYEFLPSQCAECRVFGHDDHHCPKRKEIRHVEAPKRKEEMKWRAVVSRNAMKETELVKELPKAPNPLVDEEDVYVVESTFLEGREAPMEDNLNDIQVATNSFCVLQDDEVVANTPSMEICSSNLPELVHPQGAPGIYSRRCLVIVRWPKMLLWTQVLLTQKLSTLPRR